MIIAKTVSCDSLICDETLSFDSLIVWAAFGFLLPFYCIYVLSYLEFIVFTFTFEKLYSFFCQLTYFSIVHILSATSIVHIYWLSDFSQVYKVCSCFFIFSFLVFFKFLRLVNSNYLSPVNWDFPQSAQVSHSLLQWR